MDFKNFPLLVSHKDEDKLFNEFYSRNLQSNDVTRKALAKSFFEDFFYCNASKESVNAKST